MIIRRKLFPCDFRAIAIGIALTLVLVGHSANAQLYNITIRGEVEFNQITFGELGNVNVGDEVVLELQVQATDFVDSPNFPTRGYVIHMFQMDFVTAFVELQDPFPAGQAPYFVLRDNDPAVDGFFISRSVDNPIGVPLNQPGQISQFMNNVLVTYSGDTLSSLEIEDAEGSYDFGGISVFNWTIDDGPFNPMGMIFNSMLIESAGSTPCQFPLGDANQDGEVNLLDVDPFVQAIFGSGFVCEADINLDGVINLLDVAPFIDLLSG